MSPIHHAGTWAELQTWLGTQPGIRAVVCDVYGTLLEVRPGPQNAPSQWEHLWKRMFPNEAVVPFEALKRRLEAGVARYHAQSDKNFPEVDWIQLFAQIVPTYAARMARHHARLVRRCNLMAGAADFLRETQLPLGICSNAQAYTLMELGLALRACGLTRSRFAKECCFWSYQHGIAKPSHVPFTSLPDRFGMIPETLLMVGDRIDNDILPAAHAGWSTWHLR